MSKSLPSSQLKEQEIVVDQALNPAVTTVNDSVPNAGHTLASPAGLLVINADDWGRTPKDTDKTLDCVRYGSVSAVSAMVFMEDSERAAQLALDSGIDAGLHLNLTTPFPVSGCPPRLVEHQRKLVEYLCCNRFARLVFNPLLASSFQYVVNAQLDDYQRLYGTAPTRIDGHHHIHLCTNVLFQGLLPPGVHVRRNFSFQSREKGRANLLYRSLVDRMLARRHLLDDFFFFLLPLEPISRLEKIFSLALRHSVEVETHPINSAEHIFLRSADILGLIRKFGISFPLSAANRRHLAAG